MNPLGGLDFFGGGGGYSFDLGATSGAQGGSNTAGGFSVGAFNLGGSSSTAYVVAGLAAVVLLAVVFKK